MGKRQRTALNAVTILALFAFLYWASGNLSEYHVRLLNNSAIFITLAVSYNLVNGVCGQFSLAPHAFVAVGAYTSALLTMSPAEKELSFIIEPLVWPLSVISLPFWVSLLAAGAITSGIAFLMAFPVFRVRGDYLAIVTLGFGEVVRVVANNLQSITNGPLGLKGLAPYTDLWWSYGFMLFTILFIWRLTHSSFGRAMKAIREDEVAAEAMGVTAFRYKVMAFTMSGFFAGVAGGLLAHLITTISPTLFTFFLTFNLLIIVVVGGLGSTTGSVISAVLFVIGGEALRVVEEPFSIGALNVPGIPGMRMVIFAVILIVVMIFARQGIMGQKEFSWEGLAKFYRRARGERKERT
ncbi:MAG TPA: branched-chain amino acid ABC transporter permease [Thermodesulfobacteriota bacterium]|nr:branched-chain amino acid ABC transporter permease [Thermodesulfobacteriota bacterium]